MVRGLPIPKGFSAEAFESAIDYKPKHGDLFVASYPKCGTTWTQKIILLILRKGKPSNDSLDDMFFSCPYLELSGVEAMESTPKPLAIKIHLPYHLTPMSKDAKYVYVCRNPMDCAVSCYHHLKNSENLTFDQYFEDFISGNSAYGDYLDHLIGWYEHRDDANVHFVTYEDLKKDPKKEILKIAGFIGEEYEKMLVDQPKILKDVITYSSFDYMKKQVDETMRKFWKGEIDAGGRSVPKGMKMFLDACSKVAHSEVSKKDFMRKGVVGDWKNHFSSEQKRRYEEKIAEKTANSDVMSLWK